MSSTITNDPTEACRLALRILVKVEEDITGSRDLAYEAVAKTVSSSTSWVKKFTLGAVETKEPKLSLFVRISAAYQRICEQIEQQQEVERSKNDALRRALDAVTNGLDPAAMAEIEQRLLGVASQEIDR